MAERKDTKHEDLREFLDGEFLCAFSSGFTPLADLWKNRKTGVRKNIMLALKYTLEHAECREIDTRTHIHAHSISNFAC